MRGVYPSGPECPPVWGESSEVAAARLVVSRVAWSLAALAPKKPLAFKEYTAGKYFGELGDAHSTPESSVDYGQDILRPFSVLGAGTSREGS